MIQVLFDHTQYDSPGFQIPDCEFQDIVELCDARRIVELCQDQKPKSGWVAPAILHPGAKSRMITDVARMSAWFGGDVDHANWTMQTAQRYLGSLRHVIYSTTRSTDLERRWRFFTPLSREMSLSEFAGVWRAINLLLDGELDIKTRNVNRLHYLPATWYLPCPACEAAEEREDGCPTCAYGNNEYHKQDGAVLDVDELLAICPPEEAVAYPAVIREEIGSVRAPDGTEILTQSMLDKHVIQGQIGGRFFKLLCAAATRYKANGWTLTASELASAALQVLPKDSSGLDRAVSAHREAARAITYIDARVETTPEKDKVVNKMLWKWQHQTVKTPT